MKASFNDAMALLWRYVNNSLGQFNLFSLYEIYPNNNDKTKYNIKNSKQNKHILTYITRPYRVQEAGKLEENRSSYHWEPISIFASNSNEKLSSGLTHELSAFSFYTNRKSDIFGG